MPILFLTSSGDCIVPIWNMIQLEDAYIAEGIGDRFTSVDQGQMRHDRVTFIPHAETIKRWLADLIAP